MDWLGNGEMDEAPQAFKNPFRPSQPAGRQLARGQAKNQPLRIGPHGHLAGEPVSDAVPDGSLVTTCGRRRILRQRTAAPIEGSAGNTASLRAHQGPGGPLRSLREAKPTIDHLDRPKGMLETQANGLGLSMRAEQLPQNG